MDTGRVRQRGSVPGFVLFDHGLTSMSHHQGFMVDFSLARHAGDMPWD